jgi:diguanylate cyclase (GGDEF)-like protein/PAS domain S-box-containing protein
MRTTPFAGIAALWIVFAILIGGYAAWQFRDGERATHEARQALRGLDYVGDAMQALTDWGRAGLGAATSRRLAADVDRLNARATAMADVPEAVTRAREAADALQNLQARPGPDTSTDLGEKLLAAMTKVADSSGLAFDAVAEPNALADAFDGPLALRFERLNAAYVHARSSRRPPTSEEQVAIVGGLGGAETTAYPLAVDLRGAFATDEAAAAQLEPMWDDVEFDARDLQNVATGLVQGEQSADQLDRAHQKFVASATALAGALQDDARRLIAKRVDELRFDRIAVAAQLVLAIAISFIATLLVSREIVRRQRRALFRAQRESAAEQFRAIFERSPIGIALLNRHGGILESNAGLGSMMEGVEPSIIDEGDPEYAALAEGKLPIYRFERQWTHSDGSALWVEVTISPVGGHRAGPVVAIAMLQDVTQRRAADASLRHAATHDALTGLPSRGEFVRRVEELIAQDPPPRYAVLFIDLDGFKAINDRLGHLAGDRVIAVAAQRIRKASRSTDFVARLHGDEFAILLVNVDGMRGAEVAAKRIQEELGAPLLVNGDVVFVSPSIGIVLGHRRYADADSVLHDADAAMYRAKALGGARAVAFEQKEAS